MVCFFQNCVYSLFQTTYANLHERLECWSGAIARLFHTYGSNFIGKTVGFFSEILETEKEFFIVLELIWGVVISFDVLKVFVFNLFT